MRALALLGFVALSACGGGGGGGAEPVDSTPFGGTPVLPHPVMVVDELPFGLSTVLYDDGEIRVGCDE